jgi:thiol-disulfide isomerase/thioredoxin
VHIISFWATWCGPCRTEIPEFDRIHRETAGKKVKILLVSLDFPDQVNRSLASFIATNRITAPVLLLNDPDANAWIDKVDPSWSGSLPATLIYKGTSRYFLEKSLTYNDLNQYILLLNP